MHGTICQGATFVDLQPHPWYGARREQLPYHRSAYGHTLVQGTSLALQGHCHSQPQDVEQWNAFRGLMTTLDKARVRGNLQTKLQGSKKKTSEHLWRINDRCTDKASINTTIWDGKGPSCHIVDGLCPLSCLLCKVVYTLLYVSKIHSIYIADNRHHKTLKQMTCHIITTDCIK